MLLSYLWYFFIYAFLGWCTEVCYAAVNTGKFVNRGFLNGPVCPMYGVGISLIVFCLTPLQNHVFLTFIGAVVLTTVLEGLTGLALEKLFHQKWWDYSNTPFNLGGYVCLKFSLVWGLACLLVLKMVHPGIAALVSHIPSRFSYIALSVFSITMLCDLIFTVNTVRSLNLRLEHLSKISSLIRAGSDDLGEKMSEATLALLKKQTELSEHLKAGEKRLLIAFPQMLSIRHKEWLERIKERVLSHK